MTEGTRSVSLGARYADHNRGRGRGFVYGGQERVDALRGAIGSLPAGWTLDLGCRDGSLATALDLPPQRTVGIDIDEESLSVAAASGAFKPCRGDLWGALPFRSESLDLVVAGEIVEHVPFPSDLIAEVARIIRPGGRFVGSVPNAFRLKNRFTFLRGSWFEPDPTHLRQFSPEMLRTMLAAHFASVHITPCVGRWAAAWPRMLGNDLVWSAVRP
jgi:2-polyprenyl-3-methyl-5-hydroxy-6-metoxy-1,4-benzoquinol methylase